MSGLPVADAPDTPAHPLPSSHTITLTIAPTPGEEPGPRWRPAADRHEDRHKAEKGPLNSFTFTYLDSHPFRPL